MRYNEKGEELPDPTPVAPPVGYKKQPSMVEMIRNMVRGEELRRLAENAGQETFEEADDFETEDMDPTSPYEETFEPTPVDELRRRAAEAERAPPVGGAQPTVAPAPAPGPVQEASPPTPKA